MSDMPLTPFATDPYLPYLGKVVLLQLKGAYAHPMGDTPDQITTAMSKEGPLAVIGLACKIDELAEKHVRVSFTSPLNGARISVVMEREAIAFVSITEGKPMVQAVSAGGIVLPR